MSRQFNNSTGTTSTEFQLGAGTGAEVRQFVLTANIKLLAKDATGTVARHIRGTVSGTTTTRITDTFQEDFDGDIAVTSNGTTFSVECTSTTSANFTIYVTLTRVSA
jgi:hypothetical protein